MMLKKVWVCLVVLMVGVSVCFADTVEKVDNGVSKEDQAIINKIMQALKERRVIMTKDEFNRTTFVFVRCENKAGVLDPAGYWRTIMDFTCEKNSKKSLLDDYIELQYHSDDIYRLDNKMHIKLGDAVIELPSQTESVYANQSVTSRYKLTDEFFNTFKDFKGDAIVRIYYRTLTGNYYRDVKVPAKKIEDIRLLFSNTRHELRAAPQ